MASSNYFQGSSALSYGLAAPILGFLYSLALLVVVIVAFLNAGVANLLQHFDWVILITDFVSQFQCTQKGVNRAGVPGGEVPELARSQNRTTNCAHRKI